MTDRGWPFGPISVVQPAARNVDIAVSKREEGFFISEFYKTATRKSKSVNSGIKVLPQARCPLHAQT